MIKIESIDVFASLFLKIASMTLSDAYDILNVPIGTPLELIKKRYHQIVSESHPDKFRDELQKKEMNAKMVLINAAYGLISGNGPFNRGVDNNVKNYKSNENEPKWDATWDPFHPKQKVKDKKTYPSFEEACSSIGVPNASWYFWDYMRDKVNPYHARFFIGIEGNNVHIIAFSCYATSASNLGMIGIKEEYWQAAKSSISKPSISGSALKAVIRDLLKSVDAPAKWSGRTFYIITPNDRSNIKRNPNDDGKISPDDAALYLSFNT